MKFIFNLKPGTKYYAMYLQIVEGKITLLSAQREILKMAMDSLLRSATTVGCPEWPGEAH